jgi:8-oxo-dGTP diphosphatase
MPYDPNVVIGTSLIIRDKQRNKILLGLRNGAFNSGVWACPGGWIDFEDESSSHAVVRECLEEIGAVISVDDIVVTDIFRTFEPQINKSCYTVYHLFDVENYEKFYFQNMEPEKCKDIRWFDISNLPTNLMPSLNLALQNRMLG